MNLLFFFRGTAARWGTAELVAQAVRCVTEVRKPCVAHLVVCASCALCRPDLRRKSRERGSAGNCRYDTGDHVAVSAYRRAVLTV